MNSVQLVGKLASDAKNSGSSRTGMSVATEEHYTGKDGNKQERVEYHYVVAWGKLADEHKSLKKGTLVCVEGKIQTRSYCEGPNDNQPKKITEIVARSINVIKDTIKNESAGNNYTNEYSQNDYVMDQEPPF